MNDFNLENALKFVADNPNCVLSEIVLSAICAAAARSAGDYDTFLAALARTTKAANYLLDLISEEQPLARIEIIEPILTG